MPLFIGAQNRTITGPYDIYDSQVLPPDMRFGSGQVISIVGYGSLFVVSSVANFVVLKILIARYRKTKSRVNLLLCHLAIADLLVCVVDQKCVSAFFDIKCATICAMMSCGKNLCPLSFAIATVIPIIFHSRIYPFYFYFSQNIAFVNKIS